MVSNSIFSVDILDDRVDFLNRARVLKENFTNKYQDLFTGYINFLMGRGIQANYNLIKNYLDYGTYMVVGI